MVTDEKLSPSASEDGMQKYKYAFPKKKDKFKNNCDDIYSFSLFLIFLLIVL